ncbi:condensation domain-containing protein, partial [Pseudoalteromonas sp. MMG007]|uniref:condensation domain-containing protein n=1 Tax=Pseudoalteromonas sp. MMG007 TaxID=2822684 RepID=UPI001B6693FE
MDNFFQLGGHSLLATKLVTAINRKFEVEMPLKTVFIAPTLQALATSVDRLDKEITIPVIQKVERDQKLFCSYTQNNMWMGTQIGGNGAQYNISSALKLKGELNIESLKYALDTILERHESLRTCFEMDSSGEAVQVIHDSIEVPLNYQDVSSLSGTQQQLAISTAAEEESSIAFDLQHDLMMRVRLYKLAAKSHVLFVTLHHIAADGWSMALLVKEFCALYEASLAGVENPLPALPVQYADYAHWQLQWLQGDVLNTQLDYWKRQLDDLPTLHSIPLDYPRPAQQSFAGNSVNTIIRNDVLDRLKALCQSFDASLFMGLQAAFAVLLSRYSHETDIVMGTPIANREQVEVAELIGCFINTLVLRSDLSGEPNFKTLLAQSRDMLLNAYGHQQVPLEKLIEELQPQRSQSHSPLFQVMLTLQNNETAEINLTGLELEPVEQASIDAKYDFSLLVSESELGLELSWIYSTALFSEETMIRMAAHFEHLIQQLVNSP